MENKFDNAIVQADAEKNTAPNAEIKKITDENSKSTLETKELNAPDIDEAVNDEMTINISKTAENDDITKKSTEGRTFSVAEAMRKIMSLTAEMNKDTDESADIQPSESDETIHDTPTDASLSETDKAEDQPETTDIAAELPDDNFGAEDDISESDATIVLTEDNTHDTESEYTDGHSDISVNGVSLSDDIQEDVDEDYDNDDGYIIEDEFDSIPDSFFDDSDNSSISALLYNDDDDSVTDEFEKIGSVSFAELKDQMQRIKDEAMELRANETVDSPAEDNTTGDESVEEDVEDSKAEENEETEVTDNVPAEAETKDGGSESPTEEAPAPEKKNYVRDIDRSERMEADEEEAEAPVNEHIITIDRSRVKENSVPEGRLIDTVFDFVELLTFASLIMMMLFSFVFRYTIVSGPSMMPTFNDGDRLITSNIFYQPKRGDVVVFDDRSNQAYEDGAVIKRIIGLPGDVVKIEGGIIMVKEKGSDEFKVVDYVEGMAIPLKDMGEVTVGEGEMFVMGDNVNNSLDSTDRDENRPEHNVGNIKIDSIIGKVILRFYAVEETFSEETQEWVRDGRIVFDTDFTKDTPEK